MGKKKNIFISALTVFLFSTIHLPVISAQEMTPEKIVSTNVGESVNKDVKSGDQTSEEFMLEDIIVTAERRSMEAQKMPGSVVALSTSSLKESGVSDISDLQGIVPSLTYLNHGNGTFINIRGVGLTEAAPNQTTGVAVHLDGAYVAREFTTDDAFFDLERVEVLRGPQGTYVGQNASGGAIFAVSKSPSLDGVEGFAGVTFGDYNEKLVEGAVGGPVSEILAFRVSLQTETRDSFFDNLGKFGAGTLPKPTNHPGSVDRHLGRFQLLYKPSEDFDLRLVYQDSTRSTDNVVYRRNDASTWANPWEITYDTRQEWVNNYNRYTGIANWQATDDVAIKFVAAYQEMDQKLIADDDATSPYVSPTISQSVREIQIHDEYYTAEVNVLSTSDSKFQWIVGATMLDYEQPFTYQSVPYTTLPDFDTGLIINFDVFRKNYAVFGEVSYALTPTLELKVGARYNRDETELAAGSYIQPGGPHSPVVIPVSNSADFTEGSGRVVLNWQPNDENFFYISVARGYKPGGWEPFGNVYGSEIVLNKEIGWKGILIDRHLITSFDVFHMDYDGFQASFAGDVNNPTTTVTENIDGTTIIGYRSSNSGAD